MREAEVSLNELVLSVVLIVRHLVAGFNAVAGADIEHGTLREVVLIASGEAVVVALFLLSTSLEAVLFEVGVVAADRDETAGNRHLGAEVEAVALHAVGGVAAGGNERIKRRGFNEAVEVLAHREDLGNAEVIVAAEEEDVGVRVELAVNNRASGSSRTRTVLREFVGSDELGRAVFTRQRKAGVALGAGGIAFIVAELISSLVVAVSLEGVHDGSLQAGELRGLIGNRIVVAGSARKAEDIIVAAVEGISDGVNDVIGAGSSGETTHAAEAQRTEVRVDGERSLTTEDAVLALGRTILGERAVISIEAAFELEADLQAVAEVFNALDAPTGAGVNAALEAEGVGIFRGAVDLLMVRVVVEEAVINHAVKRDVSSGSCTGKSAEHRESSKGLLHFRKSH